MNNKINNTPKKIPLVKYQRSSSIPIRKKIENQKDNNKIILSANLGDNIKSRERPASRNFWNIQEEREGQIKKLEGEILNLEKENSLLNKRNNDFDLFLDKLKRKHEDLIIQLKETKDKFLNSQRMKNNLFNKLNRIKKNMELSQIEFEMFRNVKEFKMNIINSNIKNSKNFSKEKKNDFAKKIENELQINKNLEKNLYEINSKIRSMRIYLLNIREKKNKSVDKILKEKYEMEKFLINI